MRLELTPETGLLIVVPKGFDRRQLPAILERQRSWIERNLARFAARSNPLCGPEPAPPALPETINLRAAGMDWPVEYRHRPERATVSCAMQQGPSRLVLSGNVADVALCRAALHRWLRDQAREVLGARLEELARELGKRYGRLEIRAQRTRWGSCSPRGTISLNAKLLFLPPDLVDYVLLHELCHLEHPNHSARFWRALGRHVADPLARRRELRRAGQLLVPQWVRDNPV